MLPRPAALTPVDAALLRPWALWVGLALAAGAAAAPAALDLPPLPVEELAPGVYVHYGRQEEPDAANAGDVANEGFVVGTRCVAVIDTGGTYAVGRALRAAIHVVTGLPVCFLILTHAHPDHVFGAAAFAGDEPQIVGHARLRESLARRGPAYLRALERDLGAAAAGSALPVPERGVATIERLDLGGRVLTLQAWPTAHTDADLTVEDEATRTLFAGDLLFVGHVPVVDGSLLGYLSVIDALARVPAAHVLPGHGRAGAWPQALEPERRYLQQLREDVRAALRRGRTLAETVALPRERGAWLLFDAFDRRNLTSAYAELEWTE